VHFVVHPEETAVKAAFFFIYNLWAKDNITPKDKIDITYSTILAVSSNRVMRDVYYRFADEVKDKVDANNHSYNIWICKQINMQLKRWRRDFGF
jgi:hypothetical protein